MKKIIFILLVIFIGLGMYLNGFFKQFNTPTNTQTVVIEGKTYRVLVADNEIEHAKGLMNVRRLDNADGMVFLFKEPKLQIFWNQNTYLDLDVYWMMDDKVVGKSTLQSIEKTKSAQFINSQVPANKAVEIIRK